jgi:glyoxylase-like metal-dependent hydrolase (beta-lactamase superfamily II)
MKEVLPGIYQITLTLSGFNPDSVNTYLIKTPNGYTMIDTGWDSPPAVQSLEEQLALIRARIPDIRQVILTHCHIDHLGMISRFRKSHGAKINLHEKEIDLIKVRFTDRDNFLPMTDKFLQSHGFPVTELTPPEIQFPLPEGLVDMKPDVLLKGGEEIPVGPYKLRVINTPGHTPGHIALYEPDHRFLFSGDILLPTIATNAALHVQLIQDPLQKYLDSLLILKDLDIDKVLPGHEYVFSGHKKRIEELFRLHRDKSSEILRDFTDDQPRTAFQISQNLAISRRTGMSNWHKLSGWDKRFAVLLTIAHLEALRSNQKLKMDISQDIHYYSRCSQ